MAAPCSEASSSRKCATRSGTSAGRGWRCSAQCPAASSTNANNSRRNATRRMSISRPVPGDARRPIRHLACLGCFCRTSIMVNSRLSARSALIAFHYVLGRSGHFLVHPQDDVAIPQATKCSVRTRCDGSHQYAALRPLQYQHWLVGVGMLRATGRDRVRSCCSGVRQVTGHHAPPTCCAATPQR